MSFLQNHPFPVEAFFKSSLVLSYAVPRQHLEEMIPARLQLDCFENEWAFVALAMVNTAGLRPKGFPRFLGNNFFLMGCRIFVRYQNKAGKNLRGLYILKSETNKKTMKIFGNIFTHYNYSATDISIQSTDKFTIIRSVRSAIEIEYQEEATELPIGSPFKNWQEARKFAGPLPFTFTYNASKDEMLIIEGVRKNWNPQPVKILKHDMGFLKSLKLDDAILANAFIIKNVPYYWKKGRVEKWNR